MRDFQKKSFSVKSKGRMKRARNRSSIIVAYIKAFLWATQAIFFLISLTMLLKSLSLQISKNLASCQDFVPMWLPAPEATKNTGHKERFDGSLATPNAFKGSPTPEIDAAWDNITYANGMLFDRLTIAVLSVAGGVISISSEVLKAVNASEDYSVKLAPEIEGGYMASVEALHQLHRLNILRQVTYEGYYRNKAEPWQDSPQTLRYYLGNP